MIPGTSPRRTWPPTRWPACSWPVTSGRATRTSMTRLAGPVAGRIAAMAGRNFLIAGLIARSHGLHDEHAADPDQLGFSATVDSALAAYLERLSPVAGLPATAR